MDELFIQETEKLEDGSEPNLRSKNMQKTFLQACSIGSWSKFGNVFT